MNSTVTWNEKFGLQCPAVNLLLLRVRWIDAFLE